jgi:transcriptional regulator with XRE-family HTH domain
MIVGAQIRAGRAALNWSIDELAERSGVSARTIMRLEAVDGLPPGRAQTLSDVEEALVGAGIQFIGSPDDDPGIRLGAKKLPGVTKRRKRRR